MKRITSLIEPLEARIAPAVMIVDAHTATYTDVDLDQVTIKITAGDLHHAVITARQSGGLGTPIVDQLQELDLTAAEFAGTDVTFSVVKNPGGEGLVNVGYINATGRDLGKVTVPGDLGRIDCGDGNASTALKMLSVRSMGLFGKSTQLGGSLTSNVSGPLDVLKIASDAGAVQIVVSAMSDADGTIGSATIGGSFAGGLLASGQVGPVKITGDLRGSGLFGEGLSSVAIGGSVFGASITGSTIGAVTIGHDLVANDDNESGKIDSFGTLTSLTIGGSIIGGAGDENTVTLGGITHSGQVFAVGNMGPVKIGHDVRGGSGDASAKIVTRGALASLTIGGSLIGGTGTYVSADVDDGQIFAALSIGPVSITHDVLGATGPSSALILSDGTLTSATIGGSIVGGVGASSGGLDATGTTGMLSIGHDVRGGAGMNSGVVFSTGNIAGVTIGGSLVGGSTSGTGTISSDMSITMVKIAHNLVGGTGMVSGHITGATSVSIGGSVIGGSNMFAGQISGGALDSITIGHDLLGGAGVQSGSIFGNHLGTIFIGGSLVGGSSSFTGHISSNAGIDALTIGHDFIGGSVSGAATLDSSGLIETSGRIGSVTINGSIIAGIDDSTGDLTNSAQIRAFDDIGSLTVRGSLIGHGDVGKGASHVVIVARGQHTPGATSDVAIGKISIGGRVEQTNILAGYFAVTAAAPAFIKPLNADAQVGPVTVGGDWIASNLVAGAMNLGTDNAAGGTGTAADNVNFGDSHDGKIAGGTDQPGIDAKIASINIAGQVFGSPASANATDHFGFVAEQIGALTIGARAFTLAPGSNNDAIILGFTPDPAMHDMTLHETLTAILVPAPALVAAAKLVNASSLTYTDTDGDHVTVTLSKPLLDAGNVNDVFKFDHGTVGGANTAPQQLQLIDLGVLATNGVGVTVGVTSGGGDGLANVGAVTFAGFNVGAIRIPGDVGEVAGGANTPGTLGLAALSVRSMGRLGLDAQPAAFGSFSPKVGGEINGGIGSFTARQDVIDALVDVTGAIGPVAIGGSLIGGASSNAGLIAATTSIGAVKIGRDVQGGTGQGSGRFSSGLGLASLTLGGSLIGGSGDGSGRISAVGKAGAVGTLGAVSIAHDVIGATGFASGGITAGDSSVMPLPVGKLVSISIRGSLLGGANTASGVVSSTGDMGNVSIGHDLRGGRGLNSGLVSTFQKLAGVKLGGSLLAGANLNTGRIDTGGSIGAVIVGHDVLGGSLGPSGTITSGGALASVKIGGTLAGGTGTQTGTIKSAGDMGAVTIGGNLLGSGANSGLIVAGDANAMPPVFSKIASVNIRGSLLGGAMSDSGEIHSAGNLGFVRISGNMRGAAGMNSGYIMSDQKIAGIAIGDSLLGGANTATGEIFGVAGLGAISLGADFAGGTAERSGYIATEGKLASVTIRGSMIGSSNSTSTALTDTAEIFASNTISALNIGGNLIGGSVSGSGMLGASGYVESHNRILNVTIGGSIVSGADHSASVDLAGNASIRATDDIPIFTVKGSLVGNTTNKGISPVIISADGQEGHLPFNFAIHTFTVNGSVEHATIFGDYTTSLTADVANAQIGTVKVGRNWIASNVVVGVVNEGSDDAPGGTGSAADNVNFGDAHDFQLSLGPITHRIGSIVIGGVVAGTDVSGDHFGFTAVVIGSFKSAGFIAPIIPPISLIELSPSTGDVSVRA